MSDKAVSSGKVSAQEVAEITFKAIADGQFYIYSHPDALAPVGERMAHIITASNPGDPYAGAPQVGAALRAKIKPPA
jgi:hypothetical protein